MGYSCSAAASNVESAWSAACMAQTDLSNTFRSRGRTYFYEVDGIEHADGAITGLIFRLAPNTEAFEAGSFKIDGQGTVVVAPSFLRQVKVAPFEDYPLLALG